MAFYSDFAGHYEKIFPLREAVFAFLDARLPREGDVLDVGCGTGGYCARLADAGCRCTGIDLDPEMIDAARSAHGQTARLNFRVLGMAGIGSLPAGGFGGAFCLGNVLPHLPAKDLPAFLDAVHGLLAPRGVWILQTVNFDAVLDRDRYVFPELEFPDEGLVFRRAYEDISAESLEFVTELVRDGNRLFRGSATLTPLRAGEVATLHREAGFTLCEHAADFAGAPFAVDRPSGNVMVFKK